MTEQQFWHEMRKLLNANRQRAATELLMQQLVAWRAQVEAEIMCDAALLEERRWATIH